MMKPCMDCGSTDGIHGSNCATHEREPATGKPSWNEAPDWAEWLGQDGDGAWFWFEREPERQESCWGQSQGQIEFAAGGYVPAGQDWRKTLERRADDSFTVEAAPLSQAEQEEFGASMRAFTEDAFPKQGRYQDARGEDWIDEFARTATAEEFRGAMRFTIGKYLRRAGKKDALISEITKIEDYARRWREYELARGGDQ